MKILHATVSSKKEKREIVEKDLTPEEEAAFRNHWELESKIKEVRAEALRRIQQINSYILNLEQVRESAHIFAVTQPEIVRILERSDVIVQTLKGRKFTDQTGIKNYNVRDGYER